MMTREEAYTTLDRLITEKKILSTTVECAVAMALDDMMVVTKLGHLKNGMIELLEEIKELEDVRGENESIHFTREELVRWLWEIVHNNGNNDFGKWCEELIGRLDGFERFVVEARE